MSALAVEPVVNTPGYHDDHAMSQESLLAVVYIVVVLGAIAALGYVFRTFVLRQRSLPLSARLAGSAVFEAFQNRDVQHAIDEIHYTRESWSDLEDEGDDLDVHRSRGGSATPGRDDS